ncbi:hypothetical protein V6N13_076547 [Hibiscus sabdariffa]
MVDHRIISQICGQSGGYDFAYSPSIGTVGGLITLWKPEFFYCGDFNSIRLSSEKSGSNWNQKTMEDFSDFIDSPFLVDLPLKRVQSLMPKSLFDHNPIQLASSIGRWGPRHFKWFDYLANDENALEVDSIQVLEEKCFQLELES